MESANASLAERTSPTTICTRRGGAACGTTGGAAVATGSTGVMAATCVTKGGNGLAAGACSGLGQRRRWSGYRGRWGGHRALRHRPGAGLVGATAGSGATTTDLLSVHDWAAAGRGSSFEGSNSGGATVAAFALLLQPLVVGDGDGAGFATGGCVLTDAVVTMVLV